MIKGGCDLFATKPISTDRKLYKTIDKHLTQMVQDNEMARAVEKERKNSVSSTVAGSPVSSDTQGLTDRKFNKERSSSVNRRLSTNTTDTSFESLDDSPFGSLKTPSTKRTFSNLIAILNMTFPDQDFTNLQPTTENFAKIHSCDDLMHRFNNIMVTLGKSEETLNWIWERIDSYMDLIPKASPQASPIDINNSGRRMSNSNKGGNDLPCQIFEFVPSDQSIVEDLNYPYQTMWSYYWFIYNKKKKKVAFIYLTAINKVHFMLLNGNRKSSFRSNRMNNADIIPDGDEDDMSDDISMDGYDEEVLIDDESEIEDIEI